MKWVLASNNAGKLAEFRSLFAEHGIAFTAQSEWGVEDADETGLSFIENALIKARHAAGLTGCPAIADDSGLCVDALQGAPGIRSARFAGGHGDAVANNNLLLAKLAGVVDAERTARFVCALAFVRHADDPMPVLAEGVWEGRILAAPEGNGGFGYDPLFFDPTQRMSAAAMAPERKQLLSHRGQAMRRLRDALAARGITAPSA
ncbi:RdgB/HAM1 family non-canonical purine NTP pyrophosphatase [Lysobacter soyae]|uniref:dITP/XTP pyrophosphatase n=1 Tax=Lysobacter soyae TaxID=2764185 RepID=A0ABX8WR99_9GAMM|nr:RdgB/HAM1 family non-canonical purine NTP pyrophosphatase [Lysobacter sp. CJ11]QYR53359.1 RdgB/HAM1 family non-canonical purine NTP pyrophosphatase [Lysobacter sp. CJ11]